MKKKLLSSILVLSAFAVMGTSAQAGWFSKKKKADKVEAKKAGQELVIWSWYASQTPALEQIAENYMAENPDVDVKFEVYDTGVYPEQIKTASISGEGPDILALEPDGSSKGIVTFKNAGKVVDLTDTYSSKQWDSRFYEGAITQLTDEAGKIHSVPFTVNNINLFYNAAIFDEYGLDVPKTYSDLVEIKNKVSDDGFYVLVEGNKWQWTGKDYFYMLLGQLDTGYLKQLDSGSMKFTDAKIVDVFEKLKALNDDQIFVEGSNAMSDGDAKILFGNEQAIMWASGTWAITWIQENAPEDFQGKVATFPVLMDGGAPVSAGGVGMNFAVNIDTKQKDLAIDFLDYMTNVQSQKLFVDQLQFTAANKSANTDDVVKSDYLREFNKRQAATTPRVLLNPNLDAALGAGIQGLWEGDLSPKELAAKIESARNN